MLYKKNNSRELSEELFKNPTAEYRGMPFWAWNCKLDENELLWQIEQLKEMGFGGFHMHSRAGMATKYLSPEFMELIKACTEKAKKEDMLACLYDEDRWPSGSAGGYVTKERKFAGKIVRITINPIETIDREEGIKEGKPYFLSCYDVVLNSDGTLKKYSVINENENAGGIKWYAYVETVPKTGWCNGESYVDTLSKEAIDKFIEITYETYKSAVGEDFGGAVNSIFTDEPQFAVKKLPEFAENKDDVVLPWTTDFDEFYKSECGIDLIEHFPELIWDLPDGEPSEARYHYHDLISELFTRTFSDNCGKWCDENGIKLTGHVMQEQTLKSQTGSVGEAMRAYRSFGIPGIDMLCDHVELATAKQAQSACRQYGREGMLSELYGVTNWDFDFRGHKFQGDWQAALGVTLRVPHLSWVSMKGSAKRDYPASISYQSPWYKEYPYIENHFARVNTALTRGKPIVNVGVIHPIESYWLKFGPSENTSDVREQMEDNFETIIEDLLFGMIDFDFISEALLPSQCGKVSDRLNVGEMNYSAVIVPECETLRLSTVEILKKFSENGGKIIFIGECPKYVDAKHSDEVKALYEKSIHCGFNRISLLENLEDERNVEIRNSDAALTDNIIYQLREDNDVKWLFVTKGKKNEISYRIDFVRGKRYSRDNINPQNIIIRIKGEYEPFIYDTITGDIKAAEFKTRNGVTEIKHTLYTSDSLLLQLRKPSKTEYSVKSEKKKLIKTIDFKKCLDYEREEDNVYLLDMARYSLDGGKTFAEEEEEILRIDFKIRQELNYPLASGEDCQPWAIPEEKITNYPILRFEIESETETECRLAFEEAESVSLNGENVPIKENGYFVDHSIKTMQLPKLKKGKNILLIKAPIGKRTSLENYFLLGDFGVTVNGVEKKIVKADEKIGFSSLTHQGMPFYGGNIRYKATVDLPECELKIRANYYRGALIKVIIDGKDAGKIVYDPYTAELGHIAAGRHEIEFVLYGNRYNTFAALHCCGDKREWFGPEMWYTKDDEWSYEYQIKDMGILASPVMECFE